MKTLLVERLKDLKQSDEPQKDTLYYVQLDTNEVLWIKEGDIVDLACELGNPQNAAELIEFFNELGVFVDIPNVFHEDVNELIRQKNEKVESKMNKAIEYVGYEQASNDFGLLSYYYPIVKIDGEYVTIHSIKSFDKSNNHNFNHVVEELGYAILEQFDENSGYGLAFHVCGYDGAAQSDFERHYLDEYGIEVF